MSNNNSNNNNNNKNIKPYETSPYMRTFYAFHITKWTHPFKKIKFFFQDIKCFIHRGRYGWCFYDWWNLDMWFLYVMPQILEDYINNANGHPAIIKRDYGITTVTDFQEWENFVYEIINHLNEANEEKCSFKNEFEPNWLDSEMMKEFRKNKDWTNKYYTRKQEIQNYRNTQLKLALRKFGDNFESFWD